jgi:prepilin-type N-terminal cleavage/methylation domain-containing protein
MARRLARLRPGAGYSLTELVVVLAITGLVLTAVSLMIVRGTNAELDTNHRYRAQQDARTALDRLRRDAHCASAAAPTATLAATPTQPAGSSGVTLTLPAGCPTGSGAVTWCVSGAAAPYSLWRRPAATCTGAGTRWGVALASDRLFTLAAPAGELAQLHVYLAADTGGAGRGRYELVDDLVLRNSARL